MDSGRLPIDSLLTVKTYALVEMWRTTPNQLRYIEVAVSSSDKHINPNLVRSLRLHIGYGLFELPGFLQYNTAPYDWPFLQVSE